MPVFEKDLVLIYFEDEPTGFARVEEITPDIKKDWYHVRLLLLNLPLQTITWILRDVYIDGAEFTMGGHRIRLEKVEAPKDDFEDMEDDADDMDAETDPDVKKSKSEPITIASRPVESHMSETPAATDAKPAKIISFDDFKNRKK